MLRLFPSLVILQPSALDGGSLCLHPRIRHNLLYLKVELHHRWCGRSGFLKSDVTDLPPNCSFVEWAFERCLDDGELLDTWYT